MSGLQIHVVAPTWTDMELWRIRNALPPGSVCRLLTDVAVWAVDSPLLVAELAYPTCTYNIRADAYWDIIHRALHARRARGAVVDVNEWVINAVREMWTL